MPIAKNTARPQIPLDTGVHGSLPVEGLPLPTEDVDATIAYWHKGAYGAGQWVYAVLQGGVGMDVEYDPDSGILTITNTDHRVAATFTVDANIVSNILANAVLSATVADDFTADAELV